MMATALSFERALNAMPRCLDGGFDPLQHKTVADLHWLAQHELDLYEEGEDTDIKTPRQLVAVQRFLAETRGS